jgi:nicotinate-nucleotide adenylyltransferase
MKVGLYFGSFNPIHIGHLIIANYILKETDLQKVWFVVSPQNPFKTAASLLNEYDRIHLIRVAIEGDARLTASDVEFGLPKPSYTSHTLTYLVEKHPSFAFTIIMGSDSFQNLGKWKNADSIIKNFPIMIYRRPGFEVKNDINADITALDAPLLEISATQIRETIQKGGSIRYLVPETVREEIDKASMYKRSQRK